MTYGADSDLNDFLYCTEKFGERPCKIVLTFNFDSTLFIKILGKIKVVNVQTEVIPSDDVNIINEKYLILIDEDMYVGYTHVDKNLNSGFISNVTIYYKIGHKTEELLENLDKAILEEENEDLIKEGINVIINSINGLSLLPIGKIKADYDNIDYYYNDSVLKASNKLIKKINKKNKGLSIIYGQRGTGKTTLINHMVSSIEKTVIFIPISMIEMTINNPEFLTILSSYNPLVIIDDCEFLFDNLYTKSNIAYSNILQIVDGFISDTTNTHILLSFNTDNEENIDEDLLESNNLIKIIKLEELKKSKANELCEHLKHDPVEDDILLVDLLNNNKVQENEKIIGY